MEMQPPAQSVVVGATVVKRFPGYGNYRGTIAEINGGKALVHWSTTDERTTLTLKEAAKRVVAIPSEGVDDDDQSVTSAAFGIESSATSFTEHGGALHAAAPRHVLLELDDEEDMRSIDGGTTVAYDSGAIAYEGDGDARTTSSRFWGVNWDRTNKKWQARYTDADGKYRSIGCYDEEEEAARAVNKAIRDAGLGGRRKTNAVDATGALVPKAPGAHNARDRSAVVAPDAARAPSETTSKFWGVTWHKGQRRWAARYKDADGKRRHIGLFDTQEQAAHAVNAAIRRAGLGGKRRTNPVVDGQLVPRARKAAGHGKEALRKRRRDEPAAAPSPRARRR